MSKQLIAKYEQLANQYFGIDVKSYSKKYDIPNSEEALLNRVKKGWRFINENFPQLTELIKMNNSFMKKYGLPTPRGDHQFGWLVVALPISSILQLETYHNESPDVKMNIYIKLKSILFDILIDDIGDTFRSEKGLLILKYLKEHIFNHKVVSQYDSLNEDKDYLEYIISVFKSLCTDLTQYSKDEVLTIKYIEIMEETLDACISSWEFNSALKSDYEKAQILDKKITQRNIFNRTMHIEANNIIDLMYLSNTDYKVTKRDIELLGKLSFLLESLGRIGDDIATWQREINEMDFSSSIARSLIFNNNINYNNLKNLNESSAVVQKVLDEAIGKYILVFKEMSEFLMSRRTELDFVDYENLKEKFITGFYLHLLLKNS